jgi:hypothetical protein
MEIGETLKDWHRRLGTVKGDRGSFWGKWRKENIPEISERTVYRYMALARNKQFLESRYNLTSAKMAEVEMDKLPWISDALKAIAEKDAENQSKRLHRKVIDIKAEPSNGSAPKSDLLVAETQRTIPLTGGDIADHEEHQAAIDAACAKTPLEEIAEWLERYILDLINSERDLAEIVERVKVQSVAESDIRKVIEAACANYPEYKKRVLKAIL